MSPKTILILYMLMLKEASIFALSNPFTSSSQLASRAAGLKMYLGETFSNLHLKNVDEWVKHFDNW